MLAWFAKYPCECSRGDHVTPPDTCGSHDEYGTIRRVKVAFRIARLWMRRDRKVAS
jgi:hypothetical protein